MNHADIHAAIAATPIPVTNTFSFRAKYRIDVDRFFKKCRQSGLPVTRTGFVQNAVYHDFEIEIQSTLDIAALQNIMKSVNDSQIMLGTLRPCHMAENSMKCEVAVLVH